MIDAEDTEKNEQFSLLLLLVTLHIHLVSVYLVDISISQKNVSDQFVDFR